jgi:hypothetical protein
MVRPVDIRQSLYRYELDQLFSGTGQAVDKILESINSDLIPPFRIMAANTLTVSVETVSIQNPLTSINHTFAPVGGYISPSFTSGTVVFPVASGGNIVVTPGSNVVLTLSSGNVCKVLLYVTSSGNLAVKVGRGAASVATAVIPSLPNNCYSIGYVVVRNVGGVIQPVPASDVYRFTGQSFASARSNTGFVAWDSSGTHYSIASDRLTILHSGSGFIQGTYVTWLASQTTSAFTANTISYVYIDANGLIQTTTTRSDALYQNNIVLFEVFFDGTNYFVAKEAHPYGMETEISRFLHSNIGAIISDSGANIVRVATGTGAVVGDRQIKIVGAAILEDHGLQTTVPDSAGAAITWNHFYLNSSGKWIRHLRQSGFPMVYNNSGTITALTNEPAVGSVAIATLFVGKDDFDGTPLYFSVIDGAVYDTINAAKVAITNGTFQDATNELDGLELAKLGNVIVVNNASGGYISNAIIGKDTVRAGGGGSGSLGDHSALNNLLEDTHTQYVLLAGRASGQTVIGAQNASGNLILRSTANATKGKVWVDEVTNASSPTVAAFVVAGGAGIGGNVHVGQDVFLAVGQKLDVAAGGVLNVGTVNATTINIGHSGATVNLFGAVTSVETVNVQITDKLVLINKGGGAWPDSSGFEVERTGGNVNLITDTALASKWKIGYAGSESEILTAGTTQTITGSKTFQNSVPVIQNISTANNTLWLKQTTTAANQNIIYGSVVDSAQSTSALKFEVNNGTAATALTAARPYFSFWNGATELGRVDSNGWNFLVKSLQLPVGTLVDRPSPAAEGHIRYNTDSTIEGVEFYEGFSSSWRTVASRTFATAQAIVFG